MEQLLKRLGSHDGDKGGCITTLAYTQGSTSQETSLKLKIHAFIAFIELIVDIYVRVCPQALQENVPIPPF